MSKTRIKTYDKIIIESLALFNEHGERAITTNHIAAHLGISPGNLYYHFRNKEEIIHQIFLQYTDFIRTRLAPPPGRTLHIEDLAHYLDTAFQAMWRYRFMFYDLPGLLARNPQMQEDYQRFLTGELTLLMEKLFREFAALGLLSFPNEDTIHQLSVNVWLVTKFWFAFEQTAKPTQPITEATGRRGARQVLSLLRPYIQPAFVGVFDQIDARYRD